MNQERKQLKERRLAGIIDSQPRLGPQTVHFDIANGCNVRCTTCWHHSEFLEPQHVPTIAWKRRALSLEKFREIIDDLVQLEGLEQIILSGMGDPSLNPELVPMVRYAHSAGIGVTIITNLLAVDVDELLKSQGELNLLTSICGVTEQSWESFHGGNFSNGFERLLGQLDKLKKAKFLPKHVQVINNQNYHEVPDMVRFAKRWPAKRVNFKFASLVNGTQAVALSERQKQELTDTLIPRAAAIAELSGVENDLEAFKTQIDHDSERTAPIENVGCYMATIYCRITVDLEVLYCCNTEISVGHINDGVGFADLWSSDAYQSLRQRIHGGDFFDSCNQCGKYKQNYKWAKKLGRLELPQPAKETNGRYIRLMGANDGP